MDCQKLDLNRASAEDLESRLGLNEHSAMLVVTAREDPSLYLGAAQRTGLSRLLQSLPGVQGSSSNTEPYMRLGGQFSSLDDLLALPGIGSDILTQNRQMLCCGTRAIDRDTQHSVDSDPDSMHARLDSCVSTKAAPAAAEARLQHPASGVAGPYWHQQQVHPNHLCSVCGIERSRESNSVAVAAEAALCSRCRCCCCCCQCSILSSCESNGHLTSADMSTSNHADPDCLPDEGTHGRELDAVSDTSGTKRKSEEALDGRLTARGKRFCCQSPAVAAEEAVASPSAADVASSPLRSPAAAAEPSDSRLSSSSSSSSSSGGGVDSRDRGTPHRPCRHIGRIDGRAAIADDVPPHLAAGGDRWAAVGAGAALAGASRPRRLSCRTRPPPAELESWLKTFQSWGSAEKLHALDDLIEVCDSAHVRHMMAVIEPQFQRDFISLLPKELALHVLSFLDAHDLLRAAQTCRAWRVLAQDGLLWRERCREEAMDASLPLYARTLTFGTEGGETSARLPWKSIYMRQLRVEHNWQKGPLRPPKILRGHDDHVITCLEFSANRIVSGSDDNTLKVWSVETGRCLRNLIGHTGGVWSSQMKDRIVVSGSTDRTLKVWDTESGQCMHTLHGHTSTVRCLHLHGDIVVSGSRDATLRMWNIRSGECVHVLAGHAAAVRCVQYDGTKVVSGAYDYTVRVWDPTTESCVHVLQGHTNRVYSLQFDGVHIVSGSLDTSIRVWDVESGACKHTLVGHQSLTSGMELKDNILVSGNADSTVKVWDITSGRCLQTLQGPHKHQSAVTCLQFNRKFVITSSDDGTVKLWSLKTGEFLRNLVSLESGGSGGVVWRVKADNSRLVCAAGSRNGTEETKLLVLDFDLHCSDLH